MIFDTVCPGKFPRLAARQIKRQMARPGRRRLFLPFAFRFSFPLPCYNSPMRGVALASTACAACAMMAYAVRGRSSTLLAPSVYRGSRHRRSIALTFDDGPSEGTNQLLEILNRYQAPATFFVCGMNVRRLPGVAHATAAAGHEIGNHSYSHPPLYLRSTRFIY